ncbi:MAG: hypothetical protein M0P71_01330 [Melioribacteraceae bacterium]|nr:hypothetical protein [Melioribacteraceae bacterium]
MSLTATGVSPKIIITAEDYQMHNYGNLSKLYKGMVNPPVIDKTGIFSGKGAGQQIYPTWNFEKIVEPRFEGVSVHTGRPSNKPDFISEVSIIGLLRSVDLYIAPRYAGFIKTRVKTPKPKPPSTGA